MGRHFEIAAQQIFVGTATNGFRMTFYSDYIDNTICKIVIDQIAGTLAATTLIPINRCGFPNQNNAGAQTTTIPTLDTTFTIAAQINGGDEASSVLAHGAGFGA